MDSTWKPKLALLSSWGAGSFFMPETGSWKPHISLSEDRHAAVFPVARVLLLSSFHSWASFSWSICEIQICIRGFGCGLGTCISSRRCSCSQAVETAKTHSYVVWVPPSCTFQLHSNQRLCYDDLDNSVKENKNNREALDFALYNSYLKPVSRPLHSPARSHPIFF